MNRVLITATVKLVSDSKKDTDAIKNLLSECILDTYEEATIQVSVAPIRSTNDENE